MIRISFRFLLTVALIVLSACGNSPLLHHLNADDLAPTENHAGTENCPLEFHQAKLCASLSWAKSPSTESESTAVLKFWDSVARNPQGPYIEPSDTPFVQLWMPDMGHGSSPVTMAKISDGVYNISKIFFVMGGEWDVRVQLKKDRQVIEQAIQSINIQ